MTTHSLENKGGDQGDRVWRRWKAVLKLVCKTCGVNMEDVFVYFRVGSRCADVRLS